MDATRDRKILVTGATGFIGGTLVPALSARGWQVVAASRRPSPRAYAAAGVQWRTCDLLQPDTLPAALAGTQVAYYLVHSMGRGNTDFRQLEQRAAQAFIAAAAKPASSGSST